MAKRIINEWVKILLPIALVALLGLAGVLTDMWATQKVLQNRMDEAEENIEKIIGNFIIEPLKERGGL